MINGTIRAARLDVPFYEEVEHDPSYDRDALGLVILVSLVGALGSFLSSLFAGEILGAILGFIIAAIMGVFSYYLWAYLVHFIGTSMFKGTGDRGEVLRCLGFAYAPRLLNILSFVPCLGPLVGLIAWVWSMATGFVAVRQSMDLDNTNAALTVIISAVIVIVITLILGLIFAAIGIAGAAVTGGLG